MAELETTVNIQIRISQCDDDQDNAQLRIQLWTNKEDLENPNTRDFASWLGKRILNDYRLQSIELDDQLRSIESGPKKLN